MSKNSSPFCDLLCGEDAGVLTEASVEHPLIFEFSDCSEESIAEFIETESDHSPGLDYPDLFQSRSLNAEAREDAISWILKVQAYYQFSVLTAYLAVNYIDRFMASHCLPQFNGWPMQLLAVACLSLAAKMEETLVPSLVGLQIEDAKFIFEPRTVCKMEFLVLAALNWRLRSVTPFNFISCFACKADQTGAYTGFLISRATQIILATIHDVEFLHHCPSSMAAAAILCAANEAPCLAHIDSAASAGWCIGLDEEGISSCYEVMQGNVICRRMTRPSQIIPQLRITTNTEAGSASPPKKRRRMG